MLVLVLAAIVASYAGRVPEYVETWQLSRSTQAEVRELRGEHEGLRKRAGALERPSIIELEARKLGMAKPGERVYVIKDLPKK